MGLGLAGAFALTRVMGTLLLGISATDPVTFVGVSLLLIAVGLLAGYIPARRASRVTQFWRCATSNFDRASALMIRRGWRKSRLLASAKKQPS